MNNPTVKNRILLTALLSIFFLLSACDQSTTSEGSATSLEGNDVQPADNYKVTGVGGIFFKSANPEESRNWYSQHLGLQTNEYGSLFEYREGANPNQKAYLQWSPFGDKTKYFLPSEKEYMINFRVGDLPRLLEELKANGVEVLDTIEEYPYGKFAHIMDPDGIKIELWEAADSTFTAEYEGKTTK